MLEKYAFIAIAAIITLAFPLVGITFARIIRPRKPNPVKQDIYECGLETIGESWVQFRVQYYLYALVFVLFDVEAVFLFPWAVSINQLGLYALVEMFIFLGLLIAGLAYAWKRDALRWV